MKSPFVSIIIVNYNGKEHLQDCFTALQKQSYGQKNFEVILVDNNSNDTSVKYTKTKFPWVIVVESDKNLGFSAGCNLGVRHSKGDYLVFLNNDTIVEANWLSALVKRAVSDPSIAAVNSKTFLYHPFIELTIHSDISRRSELSKTKNVQLVGVLVEEVQHKDTHLQPLIHYQHGFFTKEEGVIPARWTKGEASILIPCDPKSEHCLFTITIHSEKSLARLATNLSLSIKGYKTIQKDVLESHEVRQYTFSIPTSKLKKHFLYQVQNAGNVIFKSGFGRDRGAAVRPNYQVYELDSAFYNQPAELAGFCGVSVLISKKVFDELNGFDENFFMYYEDVDLSLRMKRKGYAIFFEPTSVLHHRHAASSKENSKFFRYHVERNHFALLVKHFPLLTVARECTRYLVGTILLYVKMWRWKLLENWDGFEQQRELAETRVSVIKSLWNSAPTLLKARNTISKTETVSMNDVMNVLY